MARKSLPPAYLCARNEDKDHSRLSCACWPKTRLRYPARVGREIDPDGDTGSAALRNTAFIYDGNQIVLRLDNDDATLLDSEDISHRYLWNPQAVDYLFADEQVDFDPDVGVSGDYVTDHVYHALGDNQNSVRDIVKYSGSTTTLVTHQSFDSFGNMTQSVTVDFLFDYTGRPRDEVSGLLNNLHRWYDTGTGRFPSEDPIGIDGQDPNFTRYCGNGPTNGVDPSGLSELGAIDFSVTSSSIVVDISSPPPFYVQEDIAKRERQQRGLRMPIATIRVGGEKWRGYLWQGRFASFVMDEPYLPRIARSRRRNYAICGSMVVPVTPWATQRLWSDWSKRPVAGYVLENQAASRNCSNDHNRFVSPELSGPCVDTTRQMEICVE